MMCAFACSVSLAGWRLEVWFDLSTSLHSDTIVEIGSQPSRLFPDHCDGKYARCKPRSWSMHWFLVGWIDNGRKKIEISFIALSIKTIGFLHAVFAHQTLTRGPDLAFGDQIVRKDLPMGGGATLLSVVAESTNWKVSLDARGAARPLTS
jgi:hypothetical protein